MILNFSARVLIVLLALIAAFGDFGVLSDDTKDGKGRGLTELLGLGPKKTGYSPNPYPDFGAAAETPAPSETIKYKVYTMKSMHAPLVITSASKLKKNEKKYTPGARIKMIIADWMYEDGTQLIPAQNIKNEYMSQKRPENIVIVDWSGIGANFQPDKGVEMAKKAGKKIAEFITTLIKEDLLKGLSDVDIIGMGGGAHVAAVISNRLKKNSSSGSIARITGLDPTGPGFDDASEENKLDSSDADFVDILHCNRAPASSGQSWWHFGNPSAGKERYMGGKEPCGTMDSFINGGYQQPGCEGFMGHLDSCSHTRCFDLFALSIKGLELHGCECEDWGTFLTGSCDCQDGPLIGDSTPANVTGTYYIKTSANINTKVVKKGAKSKQGESSEEKAPKKSEEVKDEY